ncbi:MAG TPA: cupin domain-containing protein [Gaiellaceae bacterium]|nr:cupin domain-containing protein [Gaiellaceae bacterium]
MGLAHWDEVEAHRLERGPMAATWQRLGAAAGAQVVGINRVRVEPGRLPTPPHSHGLSEEIYFVLGGSGLLWQDEAVCEVRAGDTVVQVADRHEHTFRAAPDGLEYLVFGTRHPVEYGWLPRSRALRLGYPWVEGRVDDPWQVEAEVGELEFAEPGGRPANVVALDEQPLDDVGHKALAGSAGSERSGLNWHRAEHGRRAVPPHCHSAEEEAFVVLEGSGTLELLPSPTAAQRGVQAESHELRTGHLVSRPAATRVSHSIVGGPRGISYLAYGTREPNDIAYYPRSNTISFRGVGLIARLDALEYGDGEPDL